MSEQKKIHTLEELQKLINGWDKSILLSEYLNPEDVDVSEVPYETRLQQMMGNPKAVQELLKTGNKAFVKKYAQSILNDKGLFDMYEMNLDNITEELKNVSGDDKFSKEDILGQKEPYRNINGSTLEAIAKVNGWDFPSMLKMIEEAQTKQARNGIYDDNLVARTVFPRISKNLMETGDYDWQDVVLDLGENTLQAVPLAGSGTKVAMIGARSGLGIKPILYGLGGSLVENATVPTVMAAADEIRKDDRSLADFGVNAATGTAVNSVAGRMVKAGIGGLLNNPAIASKIEKAMDTGDEALKNKLTQAYAVLKNPRKYSEQEIKNATNTINLLTRKKEFTNPELKVNIADYAANNSKARKVGKKMRDDYEGELIAKSNEPWVKRVRKNEERYKDPQSAYFTNRETLFPHMFVNQRKVGSQAGLVKKTGQHNLDKPEFNIFAWNDLEPNHRVANQLKNMFAGHRSKTFHYGTDFDEIVDGILRDPEMTKAIVRAYGGVNPREAVASYLTNKLGRSEWLREGESAAARSFGEWVDDKDKKKE